MQHTSDLIVKYQVKEEILCLNLVFLIIGLIVDSVAVLVLYNMCPFSTGGKLQSPIKRHGSKGAE